MQLNLKPKSKFYLLHNIFKIHGSTLISGNESCRYTKSANSNEDYRRIYINCNVQLYILN